MIAISSPVSARGFLDSQFKPIGTVCASMLNKCIVRLGVLHVTSRRVDGFARRRPWLEGGHQAVGDRYLTLITVIDKLSDAPLIVRDISRRTAW